MFNPTLSLDNGFNQDWYCKYYIVVFSRFLYYYASNIEIC